MLLITTSYRDHFGPIAAVESTPPLAPNEALWFEAALAIHRWPRTWWVAMMVRAGLVSLRRKKDRCVQVTLDERQCFRRHGHAGDCRFGRWSGGLNTAVHVDTKDPMDGAVIRRKKRADNKEPTQAEGDKSP